MTTEQIKQAQIKANDRVLAHMDSSECVVRYNGEDWVDQDKLIAVILRHIEARYTPPKRELLRGILDSDTVMKEWCQKVGENFEEFERITVSALNAVRNKRMAVVSEASSVVTALKDIRQFFLGPTYEEEKKRLSEFVDLCERLKVLKDSGFLDTVADTMLRLNGTR